MHAQLRTGAGRHAWATGDEGMGSTHSGHSTRPQNATKYFLRTLAMTSGLGVPSRSVISSSWCTTLRPGNSGLPAGQGRRAVGERA